MQNGDALYCQLIVQNEASEWMFTGKWTVKGTAYFCVTAGRSTGDGGLRTKAKREASFG